MTVHAFKWYLHEHSDSSEFQEELERQGLPPDVAEKIMELRPFYEVEFDCQYDTKTGKLDFICMNED
jgi:hypothetical protein